MAKAENAKDFDGAVDLLNQKEKELPREATENEKKELLAAARKVRVKPTKASRAEKNAKANNLAAEKNRVSKWRAKNKAAKNSRKRNRKK